MNAPTGVDTDTSGEETTPPPSPKPEQAKPTFSLTSFFPTRHKSKIKGQTPEQAVPTASPTSATLRKKQVRIAENAHDGFLADHSLSREPLKDLGDTKVIAVLKQLLANNALDAGSSAKPSLQVGSDPSQTHSRSKSRPTGLDLSCLFTSTTSPKNKPWESAVGTPAPCPAAPLPAASQYTPPWLWTVPSAAATQADARSPTGQTGPPAWTGIELGIAQHNLPDNTFNPYHSPPYPPVYPHPHSFQPWQPHYMSPCRSSCHDNACSGVTHPATESSSLQNPWSPGSPISNSVSAVKYTEPKVQEPASAAFKSQVPQAKDPAVVKDASLVPCERPGRGHSSRASGQETIIDKLRNALHNDSDTRDTGSTPSWTHCLVSLATCIQLCESFGTAAKQVPEGTKPRKHPFQHVVAKLLSGVLLQRDIVQDMQTLIGDSRDDEIAKFSREVETINTFLKHCLRKKTQSEIDGKRLSQMHIKASRALETGGLTQLLPQAFRFADILTPTVLKAISDLVNDWLDHKLSARGVIKSLMIIQHEYIRVQHSRRVDSVQPGKGVDSPGLLLQSLDIVYRLFTSASPPEQGDTEPSAQPNVASSSSSGTIPTVAPRKQPKAAQPDQSRDKSTRRTHRSPKEVFSGLVHSTPTSSQAAKRPDPISEAAPRFSSRMPDCSPTRTLRSASPGVIQPVRTPEQSPRSSPSRYSDSDSEGTVLSDIEARSLLAYADSGPTRVSQDSDQALKRVVD